MSHSGSKTPEKAYFSITAVGKGRWYWVVWPGQGRQASGEPYRPVAEGFEATKAEAVEKALDRAGMQGVWLAANYARQHYRQNVSKHKAGHRGQASSLEALEFLYRDVQTETGEWISSPHRIVRKTRAYIYVARDPHDPGLPAGPWSGAQIAAFRLSRLMLAQEGYALVSAAEDVDDPLFFTTPIHERVNAYAQKSFACLEVLGLAYPCTPAEIRAAYRRLVKLTHPDQGGSHDRFLALQAAYEQALRLCKYHNS